MTVSAGDKLKIRASEWNDVQAIIRWWKKFGGALNAAGSVAMFHPSVVWIKNTTASDVGSFGVLAIDQPIIDLSSTVSEKFNGIRFDGIAPSTSTPHYGKFAVLQEPAKASVGFARAVIAGPTLVKLNIVDADDVACDITNAQTGYLTTNQHGSARILWKSTGTGSTDKWGLVHVGAWEAGMLGKADADISVSSSGTVSIWDGAEGSETDTGVNVTAYNRFSDVASGGWVWVFSKRGRLYLIAAGC